MFRQNINKRLVTTITYHEVHHLNKHANLYSYCYLNVKFSTGFIFFMHIYTCWLTQLCQLALNNSGYKLEENKRDFIKK